MRKGELTLTWILAVLLNHGKVVLQLLKKSGLSWGYVVALDAVMEPKGANGYVVISLGLVKLLTAIGTGEGVVTHSEIIFYLIDYKLPLKVEQDSIKLTHCQ